MNRLISYGFIVITIYLFIIEGERTHYTQVFTGIALSIIVAYSAFFLNWITLDATLPVMILGTIILGFGGWWLAFAIIFFFVSSSYLTHRNKYWSIRQTDEEILSKDLSKRRDGVQVWANGFWVILFTLFWFLLQSEAFLIAAFAVIATATADTWATEIGTENPGVTKNIITLEMVQPGTDGGVSLIGTVASLIGAFIIALFTINLHVGTNTLFLILIVSISGFLGCVIDSYIGAVYQSGKPDKTIFSEIVPKNSIVNWFSTGIGGILALLLYSIV